MRWTVGQRIVSGVAVIIMLLLLVGTVGMYSLSRTAAAFRELTHQQGQSLAGAASY